MNTQNLLVAILIFGLSFTGKAQEVSVEKSIFGVEAGFPGAWVYYEGKLTSQIALRTEVGLDLGFYEKIEVGTLASKSTKAALTPTITLGPKWYYNLNKRATKGKNTSGNAANFLSLRTTYAPDLFVIAADKNVKTPDQISLIPTWGMRRTIGEHINFGTAFGVGGVLEFGDNGKNSLDLALNLQLKIGYRF